MRFKATTWYPPRLAGQSRVRFGLIYLRRLRWRFGLKTAFPKAVPAAVATATQKALTIMAPISGCCGGSAGCCGSAGLNPYIRIPLPGKAGGSNAAHAVLGWGLLQSHRSRVHGFDLSPTVGAVGLFKFITSVCRAA